MGEKGNVPGATEVSGLASVAGSAAAGAAAGATAHLDPMAALANTSLSAIDSAPDFWNKWASSYLAWRQIQAARTGDAADGPDAAAEGATTAPAAGDAVAGEGQPAPPVTVTTTMARTGGGTYAGSEVFDDPCRIRVPGGGTVDMVSPATFDWTFRVTEARFLDGVWRASALSVDVKQTHRTTTRPIPDGIAVCAGETAERTGLTSILTAP